MFSSSRKISSLKQYINPLVMNYHLVTKTEPVKLYRKNAYCFSAEPSRLSQQQSINRSEKREKVENSLKGTKDEKQGNTSQKKQTDQSKNSDDIKDEKPKLKPAFLLLSAFLGFTAYYFYQRLAESQTQLNKIKQSNKQKTPEAISSQKPKPKFGGVWSLTNTESQPFGSKQLQGTNYLIYFGFTKCPDICPNTLNYLNVVVKLMRALPEIKIKVVFVSVDPERDTPQVIKEYLSNYDQSFVGVTGLSLQDDRLKQCMKDFKVYARKVLIPENLSNYNVDHTSLVYIMNERNEFVDVVNPSLSERQSALDIARKIIHHDSKAQ